MALHVYTTRLLKGGRYFGDGSYPSRAPGIVLTDRATGQLYRVAVSGSAVSLVAISALSADDKKEDVMSVQVLGTDSYVNAYASGGQLVIEQSPTRTRSAYVHDGSTRRIIVYNGTLVAQVA